MISHVVVETRRLIAPMISVVAVIVSLAPIESGAQVRGVYPLGMSATSSGVTPDPGLTYTNMFLFYSRDRLTDPSGDTVVRGANSVLMDMNTVAWVSEKQILGSARFSFSATLPLANNSLSSDLTGPINGGGGFGDSFYQPAILGWRMKSASIRFAYGFLAPTGRFEAGATDNVGSGYWTHVVSSGQTFVVGASRATIVSAFQMYEFHGAQSGTGTRPGEAFNLDYSVMRALATGENVQVQVGVVGYSQRQTSAKSGPTVTPAEAAARYKVDALGVASIVTWPERNVSLGFKYFDELSTESTFEGYSVQISLSVAL